MVFVAGLDVVTQSLFLLECVLFQMSLIPYYIGFLIHSAAAPLNKSPQAYRNLKICEGTGMAEFWWGATLFLFLFPSFVALNLKKYNEKRLFFMSDKMTEQQQVVLEIFERQNEGVVILQKKNNEDEAEHETVLYSNDAYKRIVGSANDSESIKIPFLTRKAEESEASARPFNGSPLYSITDLLQRPDDFISRNIFSV